MKKNGNLHETPISRRGHCSAYVMCEAHVKHDVMAGSQHNSTGARSTPAHPPRKVSGAAMSFRNPTWSNRMTKKKRIRCRGVTKKSGALSNSAASTGFSSFLRSKDFPTVGLHGDFQGVVETHPFEWGV